MIKHCLLRGIVTESKTGKRDDFIVSFHEDREPVLWRRWKASAKPKGIVATGRGFNLPVGDDSQWVSGQVAGASLPDLLWDALKDTNPSTVEFEGRFFSDEKSVMDFILSR